ncbi:MAG: hypothetical protein EXR93_06810 [Gemmatimonadetes bacterium]|nr:hypothetical protein [Gemmatimonadota bacterium]
MTFSFIYLLFGVLIAAGIHVWRLKNRTVQRAAEVVLLYVLVGYCGIPMLIFGGLNLFHPDEVATAFGFPTGSPFQIFFGYGYIGMALIAVLSLRYRGAYLVAPAVVWSTFFAGATLIHVNHLHGGGALPGVILEPPGAISHGAFLHIFATHGLIAVLLMTALAYSGAWKQRA